MRKGKPFTRAMFADAGSRAAVGQTFSRLVKHGYFERVARGVYMRPKVVERIGRIRPSPIEVMRVITKTNGETVQIYGAEAVRRLGLSTQMQVLPTYYTSGTTRVIRIGQGCVRLQHVAKDQLQHAGTRVGTAPTALYYLGKNGLSSELANRIARSLSPTELEKLLASRMPQWMRAAIFHAAKEMNALPADLSGQSNLEASN
jgi:hypothetical protein